jgi:RNA polymerase sigma-70 factor (ECF subfamily)
VNLIIQEIRKRNRDVFKTFFKKHYQACIIYANGYLFDKAASEDIVQEVFLYLWENAERIEIKTSLQGYLYTMTRNRCLNYLKSIKITDNYHLLEFNINLITEQVFESNSEENKDIVYAHLLIILETLPEKMQQVVKLKFLQNYKYSEIAKEMDISINTVKTQLKRAKIRIAELITVLLIMPFN